MKSTTIHWHRLVLVFAAVAALFVFGWSRLDIEADIIAFLPQADPVIADALYIFKNHPIQDQVIIDVSLSKDNLDMMVACGQQVEKRLKASGLFKNVGMQDFQKLAPDLIFYVLNHLPVLFTAEELQNNIQPLLDSGKIQEKLADTRSTLLNLSGIGQAEFIARDPLGFKDVVMARLAYLAPIQSATIYNGQIISTDGRHLLVIASSLGSSTDTLFARQLAALIQTLSQELNQTYADAGYGVTLTPMGAYRVALDNELIVRRDVRNAILLATLGIMLLLIFTFPRPYIGLLSLLPAIAGSMMAICVFALVHQSVSLMVLGFGGAIISISVDHGIAYLMFLDRPSATYGKEASAEVWAVGLIAVLTTVGAFAALNISGFPILKQLGQFSALGISFAFIFVHAVFPLIFPAMPPARGRYLPLQKLVDKLARAGKKGALLALIFAAGMLFFAKPQFNVSLSAMNTVSQATSAAEKLVSKVWGEAFNKIYVMTEGASITELQQKGDSLLEVMEQARQADWLSAGFVPSMIFPGESRCRQNLAAWRKFWSSDKVTRLKQSISNAAADMGFTADAFAPFFRLLDLHDDYPARTDIPQPLFGLLGIAPGTEKKPWLQVSSLMTEKSYNAEDFYAKYRSLGKLFDPNFFSQRLATQLYSTFTNMLVIVGISVTILVFIFFFDVTLTLISLLPVIFALISTLGTLKLIGHPLDIPGLMLAIIVIGMGIDYSLYFVRSYQRYGDPSHPYFGLMRMTVFLAATSTIIGFGVLCAAQHSLLRSAGITSLLGIGYALIGAFVILPPVLQYLFQVREDQDRLRGSLRERVLKRYKHLEAYPRIFARFKMRFDPMFAELPRFLESWEKIDTILDIGCGFGVQAAWLLERFPEAKVFGIEPDLRRVRIASRIVGNRGVIKTGRAPEIPMVATAADLAIMLDIIHYLNDEELRLTLVHLYECLSPGHHLIIRTPIPPTRRFPWAWWFEKGKQQLARTPSCDRSAETIERIITQVGFQIEQTQPSGSKGELIWFILNRPNRSEPMGNPPA
jgi:predicted exporter/SAM-dependent methyltransferase